MPLSKLRKIFPRASKKAVEIVLTKRSIEALIIAPCQNMDSILLMKDVQIRFKRKKTISFKTGYFVENARFYKVIYNLIRRN